MPIKTVSNPRSSSDPIEIQTLNSFHQVRYLDKFLVHAKTGHRQRLVLSLKDFNTPPQKAGTETCLTWSTKNICRIVSSRLDCLVDFVGRILVFLLPVPNCFVRVCFPTLFAVVLKDVLPLITSPFSGAANSDMSAPRRLSAGRTYLRRNGIAVLPITCARAPNPHPFCIPTDL